MSLYYRIPFGTELPVVKTKEDLFMEREWKFIAVFRDPEYNDGHLVQTVQNLITRNETLSQDFTIFDYDYSNKTYHRKLAHFKYFQKY